MHLFRTAAALMTGLAFAAGSANRAQAIDGTAAFTAVVAPTYVSPTHTTSSSFVQLYNGGTSASVFTLTVVGVPSGTTYGSQVTISIPMNASVQYAVEEIVRRSGGTPGTFLGSDTGYAVYVSNGNRDAGYRHIVYDPITDLYENHSNCRSLINEQMVALHNNMVLTNLHSSKIMGFPSVLEIHNPAQTAVSLNLSLYNAGIPSATCGPNANAGKLTCTINRMVQSNSRLTLSMSTFEALPGCVIDADQFQHNIVITNVTGAAPNVKLASLLGVSRYNGVSNVTEMCAVNKVEPAVAAAPTTTAYCGTASGPTEIGRVTIPFVASFAPNGRVKFAGATIVGGAYIFATYGTGTSNGSTFTVTGFDGAPFSGSIQNGQISGSSFTEYGVSTFSATTAACSN